MRFIVAVILLLLVNLSFADRAIWYVHPDSAMNNIDAALDSCAQNDTVLVGPGTYYENIWWPTTKGICLISEYGPDSTFINGQTSGRTVYIPPDGIDSLGSLRGFTICDGFHDDQWGSGIYCLRDSFLITENVITGNGLAYGGGGTAAYFYGAPIITGNIITGNSARHGGGIGIERIPYITLHNNIITNNYGERGGGLFIGWGSMVILSNSIFTGNTATVRGGAICIDQGNAYAINTEFSGHSSGTIISTINGGTITMDSCDLTNNTGIAVYVGYMGHATLHYCNISGNTQYGVFNETTTMVDAEYNWWGDATGPYHPDSNPGGLGDWVSDYVDFIPWLDEPVGVEEQKITAPINNRKVTATIFSGPLVLPEGKNCTVFDITGRVVLPNKIKPGVYFIEVDGKITQKIIKIR